mmetsp:Transcript_4912/g.6005  ORF Transcript_4912/g.6005 Transcript_4912/m.6005 type:complete len:88 (+) Transcript_4912:145-408(+)
MSIARSLLERSQSNRHESTNLSPDERAAAAAAELQAAENTELRDYISEMLLLITTGVESTDMANIEIVADNIHTKTVHVWVQYKATI